MGSKERKRSGYHSPTAELDVSLNLLSLENIDRDSPEIWGEEKVPGVQKFMSNYSAVSNNKMYAKEMSAEDANDLNQLAMYPPAALVAKVKELHDIAYQLGVDESKEMTRGKYLDLFNKLKK